jgi:hypothetical protein
MIASAAILVLCAAGVAFYVRFLVALCKECKPRFACYWVRIRLGSVPEVAQMRHERKAHVKRVA